MQPFAPEETYCYKKYLEAQSILFCNERMCDASCEKYTFLDVKEAEEKARFDFECREEVLGAGNHICYEDAAQTDIESNIEREKYTQERQSAAASTQNQILDILLVFFFISFIRKFL